MQTYKSPIVVSEIGCNHCGDIELAKKLIVASASCGASCAKFQKRYPKELLSPEQYGSPHPCPWNSYGATYGEHREKLEFDVDTHVELKRYCDEHDIGYSTSVWDMTSARQIVQLVKPSFIKVPSACNNHTKLLDYLMRQYQGAIHISLGMTTPEEEEHLFDLLLPSMERVVVYACTSGYPVPFNKMYLQEISRLKTKWESAGAEIGFSGHHLGIAIDVAAYTLGARYIERHFTLNRTMKGTDHAASLEPAGLQKLTRDLKATHEALREKPEEMDEIEMVQRTKLKFRQK